MVSRAGFEPATKGLKDPCSTSELPAHADSPTAGQVWRLERRPGSCENVRMKRDWSVEAATTALQGLRPVLALLREQRAELDRLKEELVRLRRLERTGARPGGADQNQLQFTTANEEQRENLITSSMIELRLRALVDQMQASVDRITARGIELRDIERGLVDFPATAFGQRYLLCWEESDGESVTFAHAMGEGFSARVPLAAFLRRLATAE